MFIAAGRYVVGPNDWESEQVVATEGDVASFWLDATEVTVGRWQLCVARGPCENSTRGQTLGEPGLPVVGVSAADAQTFCRWANGRLPNRAEWLRVATGADGRRFPWGQTGLVCRRASFGLVRGPCAEGGEMPDWGGSRPDGKSPEGVYDLVGSVAEIVVGPAGAFDVRGGSFRSDHAASLKSWSSEPYRGPDTHIGFRCAYDRDPELAEP